MHKALPGEKSDKPTYVKNICTCNVVLKLKYNKKWIYHYYASILCCSKSSMGINI